MNYNGAMNNDLSLKINQLLQTAVIVVNQALEISWINDGAEALLSLSMRRVKSHKLSEVFIAGDLNDDLLKQCFDQRGHWQIEEATLITSSMEWPSCHISLTYQVLDKEPIIVIEIMTTRDHMGIRKEYQLLDQNKVSLSLVRNLAHEIKNPLSGLRGAAQLLSRKVPDDLTRFTEVIVSEADRLQNLVDRMLTPAKVEARQDTNIHQITERALEFIQLQSHPELSIHKDYDPSLPALHIAPEQVYQSLLNLLKNACEAINYSGEIILRTRAVHQHSIGPKQFRLMARIDVEDSGPGISDELKDVIFFPTISGKESSGLGLGIAQSLIRQNEGIIEFDSIPGKTCFSIYLPISTTPDPTDNE